MRHNSGTFTGNLKEEILVAMGLLNSVLGIGKSGTAGGRFSP